MDFISPIRHGSQSKWIFHLRLDYPFTEPPTSFFVMQNNT